MSLIIKKNTTFKIPRTGSGAPSGISLTAPTLYLSGLSFNPLPPWTNVYFSNPYSLSSPGVWLDPTGQGQIFYFSLNGLWIVLAYGDTEEGQSPVSVAYITAPSTSLPTTGWINDTNVEVYGTLIISTTP
jgi:hypothetical protein